MKTSPTTGAIGKALAAAQAKMKNPGFDSANPFFKSKYASLAAVRNAVVPVLVEFGIAVVQEITYATTLDGRPASSCMTSLFHESGEWIALEQFTVPVAKPDAQGACAGATYARRASLQAIACVVGDEDDDGEAVVERAPKKAPAAPQAASRLSGAEMQAALTKGSQAKVAAPASSVGATVAAIVEEDHPGLSWAGKTHAQWSTMTEDERFKGGHITRLQCKKILDMLKAKGWTQEGLLKVLRDENADDFANWSEMTEIWALPARIAVNAIVGLEGN